MQNALLKVNMTVCRRNVAQPHLLLQILKALVEPSGLATALFTLGLTAAGQTTSFFAAVSMPFQSHTMELISDIRETKKHITIILGLNFYQLVRNKMFSTIEKIM